MFRRFAVEHPYSSLYQACRATDGTRGTEEGGLAGRRVYLDDNNNGQFDPGEPSQVTDDNGAYGFTGLMPGNYAVREVLSQDYQQTSPGAGVDASP